MRIAVDFPAPFSPTMAWIVPGSTRIETRSFASTSPKRFVMSRSSSIEERSVARAAGRRFRRAFELRRQSDLGVEHARDGAAGLRVVGRRLELLPRSTRH